MARFIAFYLPQYHPTSQNDEWWGKGFTEWTNVAKAKPLFRGHKQPHIPADLGFYDLRLPEVREAQVELAKEAGIEGFMYWHYWFGNGKRILERIFDEVLASGKPDFPFCLGWANESWFNKSWTNKSSFAKNPLLLEQIYSLEDYEKHFYAVLPAFKDSRYIKVDGKPLFYVYQPLYMPNPKEFIDLWRSLAEKNSLPGIHFVGMTSNTSFREAGAQKGKGKVIIPRTDAASSYYQSIIDLGFDAVNSRGGARAIIKSTGRLAFFIKVGIEKVFKIHRFEKHDQRKINKNLFVEEDKWENVYPTILPNWDRSPRAGKNASMHTHATPEVFQEVAERAIEVVKDKDPEHQIIFIQSWNEWGEGNYMEPDLEYGKGYINALRKAINNKNNGK